MSAPPLKTAEVLDSIAGVLAPYLGKLMARASAGAHFKDLAIEGELVDPQKVEALVDKVGKGLNLFLGRDKSKVVTDEIRRSLELLKGGAR